MVFPLHDDNSNVSITPYVTWGLLLLCVILFIFWQMPQSQAELQQSFFTYGVVPAEFWQQADLPPYTPYPYWFSLISMMFLHGGFGHLFSNMLYLWIFGDNVEQAMGHGRFLLFYLLCGIGANGLHILFNAHSMIPSVGASGAISGVLAAYLILFPKQRVTMLSFYGLFSVSAALLIGFWVAMQLMNALATLAAGSESVGIAYLAHLGGFLVGLPLTFVFTRQRHS